MWKVLPWLFLLCGACNTENYRADMVRVLDSHGFTNGRNFKPCFWCCTKGDTHSFTFTAENHRGNTITGQICANIFFKAWTVRLD